MILISIFLVVVAFGMVYNAYYDYKESKEWLDFVFKGWDK
jgi:hypothetical protein